MKQKKLKKLLCPACGSGLYFNLDEWGRTPWHLHCDVCHINIGATSRNKAIELIEKYHKPYTYLEYYYNDIQVLFEDRVKKIVKEVY